MTNSSKSLTGLAHILVLENHLAEQKAQELQLEAERSSRDFSSYLIENKIISSLELAWVAARNFSLPLLDILSIDKESIPLGIISEPLIKKHCALPLYKRGENLFIAIDDPSKQHCLKDFQFQSGLNTHPIVVERDKLETFIEKVLVENDTSVLENYLDESVDLDSLEVSSGEEEIEESGNVTDDAPIVKFVHKILLDAIKSGASDIHFEPYEQKYRIRLRVDGILNEISNPPVHLANRIAARIKIMAALDISERRIPQDGRFKMKLSKKRTIDFRVSTCPTTSGEKVVMRILDPSSTQIGIEGLGFSKNQQQLFKKCIHQPQGMILVTGPTGSGKTVTLYTALSLLNDVERNISTAEDPVEIKLMGINQVNINIKAGLTFPSALRSFLRQDPDIIMVGEMRDLETAEIGVKAAQTGHLVLSTLHTNSASETLTRLVNMGVPPFNIASSVNLIIAQRLARRLCEHCKESYNNIPKQTLIEEGFSEAEIEEITLYRPTGCEHCSHGYKGRVGLFEMLYVSKEIGKIIMQKGNSLDIQAQAERDGMISIRQAGLNKVKSGITSLEEINRVTDN